MFPSPKQLLRCFSWVHRIHKASIKAEQNTKKYSYLLTPSKTSFPNIFFQTEVCIHRNKPFSLCANAQPSSSCLSFKPYPQGSLIACFLPCFVCSAVQIYTHTNERMGPFVRHSHLESTKHTCRSMAQMMAADIFRMEGAADDDPYYCKTEYNKCLSSSQCYSKAFSFPYL